VQALCQKFAANVDTAIELRGQEWTEAGHIQTAYPHRSNVYQTVIWKDPALTVAPSGEVRLPTGGQRPPNLRRAEWTWRADHYERCLTLDTGAALPRALPAGVVAGIDLGGGPHRGGDDEQTACAGGLGTTVARLQAMVQQGP
jgi:hypothetical protein